PGRSLALDTVVVTATRVEESLREVTSNVTVITEEMIKKSSASDMSQLLRQQGFDVSGTNAGGKQLRLRGMESPQMDASDITSKVLVLLNGRRIGGPNVDFIGLANVERIEVIRGPAAVQYGPSAMGGVVNIITKRGGEKTEIMAEAGMGSYDLERLKLAASGQSANGRFDFSLGAGQQYRGDYKTGKGWVWEGTRTGNQYGFNADVGLNLMEGHRIGFNYNYFSIFGSEGPYADVPYFNPANPGFTGMTSIDMTNSNMAFTYDGSTQDKAFTWQGRFSFGTMTDTAQAFSASGVASPNKNKGSMDLKNLTGILGYDAGGLFALSGGLEFLGYEYTTRYGADTPEYEDFGAFLSGKLRFLDDSLIFSAGGRFDSYKIDRGATASPDNKKQTNISHSVGLAWLPADWLKLRGNYSQGFRMPAPNEIWGSSSYLPNPDIKAEKSKTWEVGLDVNWEFFTAGLTYFRSKWDDKIIATDTREPNPEAWWDSTATYYKFENLTGATISGFELALSADLGQAFQQDFTLRPYINLTYLPTRRNKDHSGGPSSVEALGFDTLPNTSKMTMSCGVDFVEPNIDLMVNVNASYAGEKKSQNWNDPPPPPASPWVDYTPGTIVDMSLELGIMEFADMGKMKVRAEVNNLLDKYDVGYIGYPGPGRNFYVGLKYVY
ncbi:MAG: TonB-dependent receptor, partial [Deltaproteobacteria bacterium]|nr:TonB-dependent receptor [Deltaproteobacteria bacterium]